MTGLPGDIPSCWAGCSGPQPPEPPLLSSVPAAYGLGLSPTPTGWELPGSSSKGSHPRGVEGLTQALRDEQDQATVTSSVHVCRWLSSVDAQENQHGRMAAPPALCSQLVPALLLERKDQRAARVFEQEGSSASVLTPRLTPMSLQGVRTSRV